MTIFLIVLAAIGWLVAVVCFALLILMSIALAAQEARYVEKIEDLKNQYDGAILMKYRRNQNQ